jgi:hypothetical protein
VALIAGIAAIVVILAVAAITGYLLRPQSPAAQTPTAQPPPPVEPTAEPPPPATQTPQAAPTFAAVEQAACARLGAQDSEGHRCAIASMHVSTVSSDWVFVHGLGFYTGTDEPPSFAELTGQSELMILNLQTQQTIGPTDSGFCPPQTGERPMNGYTAIPAAVLADFGLSPCA